MSVDEPLLVADSVDTYYGESHVLQDVSLEIPRGDVVALIGRNGSGKTTTLRTIMGATPPRSGTITFDGEEIQDLSPHETRSRGISWVPQERRIFDVTVEENLRIATFSSSESTIDREDVYELFPRLDERRTQNAITLSGGEQQMLAIARGLLGPPTDLLLLDEPSEGLAPQIVEEVGDIIDRLNEEGVTILLVEQNVDLALSLSDSAYVLETGRIKYHDTASALSNDRVSLEKYVGVR